VIPDRRGGDHYASVEHVLATDRRHVSIVAVVKQRGEIAILAPHGGAIEPGTSELAVAIAGRDHRSYCFNGHAPSDNGRLHINSTRFEEPRLRGVLRGARAAVAIHGSAECREAITHVGGTNRPLGSQIATALGEAGFLAGPAPARLAGRHPKNLVNRVPLGGVQLELSRALRHLLFSTTDADGMHALRDKADRPPSFDRYVESVRMGIRRYVVTMGDDQAPE